MARMINRYPRLCVFPYEYFAFLERVTSPPEKKSILGRPVWRHCLSLSVWLLSRENKK
jgi:hypothetical protein